jgi:hypothetical protein
VVLMEYITAIILILILLYLLKDKTK